MYFFEIGHVCIDYTSVCPTPLAPKLMYYIKYVGEPCGLLDVVYSNLFKSKASLSVSLKGTSFGYIAYRFCKDKRVATRGISCVTRK